MLSYIRIYIDTFENHWTPIGYHTVRHNWKFKKIFIFIFCRMLECCRVASNGKCDRRPRAWLTSAALRLTLSRLAPLTSTTGTHLHVHLTTIKLILQDLSRFQICYDEVCGSFTQLSMMQIPQVFLCGRNDRKLFLSSSFGLFWSMRTDVRVNIFTHWNNLSNWSQIFMMPCNFANAVASL